MTWTQTTLNIKDAAGTTQPVIAYTDGTNFSFAHPILDNTGTIIAPATQGTLASCLASLQAATPAGAAIIGKVTTDQTTHGTTDLVAADITKVAGAAISQGHGVAATAIRVELPTDGTGVVGLAAGSAKVGVFTTDQTTHGTTDLVAADITKVGGSAVALGSTTSSASFPVVIASDQGFVPIGNNIVLATSTLTRPATTPTYTAGFLVTNNATAGSIVTPTISVARANNIGGFISQIQLTCNGTNTITHGIFRVHFYNTNPDTHYATGDNTAWSTTIGGYIGFIDVTLTQAFSDPAAAGLGIPAAGAGLTFTPVSAAKTLYWVLEARDAYVSTSGQVFTLNAWVN